MVVTKNAIMMRDPTGTLLPMEIESELFKGSVKILPLTEGDLNELKSKQIPDGDFIKKYLVEPSMTKEEVKDIPVASKKELVKLILMSSGMTREEVEMSLKKGVELMMDRLEKKPNGTSGEKSQV